MQQCEIDKLNELSQHIIDRADTEYRERVQKENTEINKAWTDNSNLLDNLRDNLIQLLHQWDQLEDILHELELKSNSLLEKDKNLDLIVKSTADIENKAHILQVKKAINWKHVIIIQI